MSLVTVGISTYNSGKFILETLESILAQSYHNIELIISDDASTDDTMEKVHNWLAKEGNKKRFTQVKILQVPINTGVSANANRKLQAASGEWIKSIGADDTLMPECIKENMFYIKENPEIRVLFSKVNIYRNTFEESDFLMTTPGEITRDSILYPERTAESQYRKLLVADRIHFSPSVFLHRETLITAGGFDERYKLLEDYPLWLNLTRNGNKLYFMDKVTVNYRRHAKAINNTGANWLINPNYFRSEDFRKAYTYPFLPTDIRLNQRFIWYASQMFRNRWLNKKNEPNRYLHNFFTIYLNPFRYYIYLKKKLVRNLKNKEFYE